MKNLQNEMGTDESVVVMSAVRYMLGRSSYGVGSVCDYLRVNRLRLTDSNKSVICRDIRKYLEDYPDTKWRENWESIYDLLKSK